MKPAIILLFFISSFYGSSAQNPGFDWAKSLGGTGNTSGVKTVSDGAGNVYVLGLFFNTVDMDPGPGVFNLTSSGESDVIFNRYGELVFLSADPQKGWDGLYKGAPLSTSAFVWQCSYQLQGSRPVYQKGTLMLIR